MKQTDRGQLVASPEVRSFEFRHVHSFFFPQVVLRYAFTQQMANVLGLELPVVDHAMYAKIAIGRTWTA